MLDAMVILPRVARSGESSLLGTTAGRRDVVGEPVIVPDITFALAVGEAPTHRPTHPGERRVANARSQFVDARPGVVHPLCAPTSPRDRLRESHLATTGALHPRLRLPGRAGSRSPSDPTSAAMLE